MKTKSVFVRFPSAATRDLAGDSAVRHSSSGAWLHFPRMDPYEERLRDEVIYLHSLWHQGPPRPSNPNSIAVSRPANRFKKQRHHNRMMHHYNHPPSPRRPTSSLEWPVDTGPPKPPPPWPRAMKADSALKQDAGSPNQQAKLSPARMQLEVLATFRKFLEKTDSEDYTDDDDDDDVAGEECKEYKFFLEVFVSNAPLREYFEKHHEDGQFWCFACQKNKKFKSCHALLQHAITISKTAWKRAHSALALVICRVLAWDSERLPLIERKGVPLSQSLLVQVSNGKRNAVVYFGDCRCVYGKVVLLPLLLSAD